MTTAAHAYLAHRRYVRDEDGVVVGELSPATRRVAAQIVIDLLNYRELFTADRIPAGLRPWGGASASAIARDAQRHDDENKTPPAAGRSCSRCSPPRSTSSPPSARTRPQLSRQIRETPTRIKPRNAAPRRPRRADHLADSAVLDQHRRDPTLCSELAATSPRAAGSGLGSRRPAAHGHLDDLAREAGYREFDPHWLPQLRPDSRRPWPGRRGQAVRAERRRSSPGPTAHGTLPWTLPLHRARPSAWSASSAPPRSS